MSIMNRSSFTVISTNVPRKQPQFDGCICTTMSHRTDASAALRPRTQPRGSLLLCFEDVGRDR